MDASISKQPTLRERFLEEGAKFVRAAARVPGVRSISLIGSIVTDKVNPKDIDFPVTVADEADLAPLAARARRLQGTLQGLNRTADVFLLDEHGWYIGRTCHWRDCRPGLRLSCDALHCGRRPHLHDDLTTIRLRPETLAEVRIDVWPRVKRNGRTPADVEQFLQSFERPGSLSTE